MLEKAVNILVLTNDETLVKAVMAEGSADFEKEMVSDHTRYDHVIAEVKYLRYFTDCREKVVVYNPGRSLEKCLEAGYERFLFDPKNTGEVLSALYRKAERKTVPPVVQGELVMDFDRHIFRLKDREIYVTQFEESYLYRRFVKRESSNNSSDRVALHRLRKKFGKDVLNR